MASKCTPVAAPAGEPSGGAQISASCITRAATAPLERAQTASQSCEVQSFDLLKHREEKRGLSWPYLGHQANLTAGHRKELVDWLIEFAGEFKLESDSLFLGVALVDRYLHRGPQLRRSSLQLLGVASMLVAVKFQETQPPKMLRESCELGDHSFSIQQIISMEAALLQVLQFELAFPTSITFLWQYSKDANLEDGVQRLAEFIALLSLLEYDVLQYHASVVAASAISLARIMIGREPWTTGLERCTAYAAFDLEACLKRLHTMLGHCEGVPLGELSTMSKWAGLIRSQGNHPSLPSHKRM
eukprot:SM000082S22888  [mRNA]  locus=s82:565452:567270:- [translate_table: standard]